MTIKTSLLISVLFISVSLLGQTQKSKFIISGQVKGFDHGAMLYLNDISGSEYKKIDSAFVVNNKFKFTGLLKGQYLKASLTSTDYEDRVTIWVEKGITSVKAEKGNFPKAKIICSHLQKKWNELTKLIDTAKNTKNAEYRFVKANPNSIISAYSLNHNFRSWGIDTISTLYKSFATDVKNSKYGKIIFAFITYNKNIKIGDHYIDFSQKDTANNTFTLSSFEGKFILIEFWGSWCNPCREENPALVKIYDEFKPKGFEIVGVASETDRTQWVKAIRDDSLNWTNTSALNGNYDKVTLAYGVTYFPTNFLIDNTGIIIAKDIFGDKLRNILLEKIK